MLLYRFSMNQWLYSIVVSVIITTIISIILPEGRLRQSIQCVFSIVLILIIVNPILKASKNQSLFFSNDFVVDENISNDYLNYVYEIKSNSLSKECENLLSEIGISGAEIQINYSIEKDFSFSIKLVNVNLSNAVISSNKEHIVVIEEAKTLLSNKLNLNKDKVNVYG